MKGKPVKHADKVDRNGNKCVGCLKTPKFDAPVEVRYIDEVMGRGVFATRDIKVGELVTHYAGVVRGNHTTREKRYDNGTYGLQGEGEYILDGDKTLSDPWRCGQLMNDNFDLERTRPLHSDPDKEQLLRWVFVNHITYNFFSKDKIAFENIRNKILKFVATEPIKKGEQVYFCYSSLYWMPTEMKKRVPMEYLRSLFEIPSEMNDESVVCTIYLHLLQHKKKQVGLYNFLKKTCETIYTSWTEE